MEKELYKKIEMSIDKDFIGLTSLLTDDNKDKIDLNIIADILDKKSSKTSGYDSDFYKEQIENLDEVPIREIFKSIDKHVYQKNRRKKEELARNFDKKVKEVKREGFVPAPADGSIHDTLRELMKDYIYIYSKKKSIVYLYFWNNTEYLKNKEDLYSITSYLEKTCIELKVIIVDKDSPIDTLSKSEKKDVKEYLEKL